MTVRVRSTITGIEEREGKNTQKLYDVVEFTMKAFVGIARDERTKWKRDQLTDAMSAKPDTPLSELIGKDVVLELSNETHKKHIYTRVRDILPLSALEEES